MTSLSNLIWSVQVGSGPALVAVFPGSPKKGLAAVFTFEDVVCQQRRHLLTVIPHGVQD